VRNLELDKSYQFRVRAENIYGISDPSPSSPPSRLMAPPKPVMDKNKKIIPLLDPYGYTEEAMDKAHAEQYGRLLLHWALYCSHLVASHLSRRTMFHMN
jgi:hypothetical protein